jgi:uncharacterized protein (DUF1778 family)
MARPTLPDAERRSFVIHIRTTEAERDLVAQGADVEGVTPAEFVRDAAIKRAKRVAAGKPKRKR